MHKIRADCRFELIFKNEKQHSEDRQEKMMSKVRIVHEENSISNFTATRSLHYLGAIKLHQRS